MPRVALLAGVVVVAVALALVLNRPGGGSGGGGEVFLQAAGKSGPDPFTASSATDSSAPPVTPSPTTESAPAGTVRGVDGGAPGLYGGTRKVAACDVEKQVRFLQADAAKNRAFASVAGVSPSGVPGYLRSLTPVQLRVDTRVTNHSYRDGAATGYQAVLQAGTAVLVDDRGVPRVRCACGNPLTPPVAQEGTPKRTGDSWPSYRASNVVVVNPAPVVIKVFVIYDPEHDEWIHRHKGDTGHKDTKTHPPVDHATPSASVSTPTTPSSPGEDTPTPCVSTTAPGEARSPGVTPCPPTSATPSSSPPTQPETTTSEPTTSEPAPPPPEPVSPDVSSPEGPPASDPTDAPDTNTTPDQPAS
ncbi:hypothetical protein SUDANB96_00583 [Streptomyces sp. enrichment culture]